MGAFFFFVGLRVGRVINRIWGFGTRENGAGDNRRGPRAPSETIRHRRVRPNRELGRGLGGRCCCRRKTAVLRQLLCAAYRRDDDAFYTKRASTFIFKHRVNLRRCASERQQHRAASRRTKRSTAWPPPPSPLRPPRPRGPLARAGQLRAHTRTAHTLHDIVFDGKRGA